VTQLRWDRPELGGGVPEPARESGGHAPTVGTSHAHGADGPPSDGLPPLHDPYLTPGLMAPRAQLSRLALTSVVAAFIGPVGAICAIVFGWIARREIEQAGARRTGRALATAGIALGAVMTMAWGGGLGFLIWRQRGEAPVVAQAEPPKPPEQAVDKPADPATTPPTSASSDPPGGTVPKATQHQKIGSISLVDVGVNVTSLQEELARQRAEATSAGETLLVMTSRGDCKPCKGVETSLKDPLMQTALNKVRIVRVDTAVFHEDLETLKMPHDSIPYFFLLALDLSPKDGINGGEWDEDVPPNIAPVLGAFIRGKYGSRKQVWRPLPGTGVRL